MGIRVRTVETYQPITVKDPVTTDEVRTKLRAVLVLHEMIKHKDTSLYAIRSFIEAVKKQGAIEVRNEIDAKRAANITIRHDALDS